MTRHQTTSKKAVIAHYLVSLPLDCGGNFHTYIMTADKRYLTAATDRMLTEAEKIGCSALGLVMATPLTDDVEAVRDVIRKRDTDAEQLWREVVDFHWSIFLTGADDPDDAKLMAMH